MARPPGNETEYRTVGLEATDLRQFAEISLEHGGAMIYDVDNKDAWVQSSSAIGLDAMV